MGITSYDLNVYLFKDQSINQGHFFTSRLIRSVLFRADSGNDPEYDPRLVGKDAKIRDRYLLGAM